MNAIERWVIDDWSRLRPGTGEPPRRLASLVKTPRFRASGHVLFFLFADGAAEPALVVKMSRLPGDDRYLDREAANLRAVQASRATGFDSVPRVLAYDERDGMRLLVQSVIRGETMDPAYVRARPRPCLDGITDWLTELHVATSSPRTDWSSALPALIDDPLDRFEALARERKEDVALVCRTRALVAPLRDAALPLVFEHGDLSSPNLLIDDSDRPGVVDWELAEARGLPAADLFFFLTYVAFARGRARSRRGWTRAFDAAFLGPAAWARPWIARYAAVLGIPDRLLRPLFVLGWARYVSATAMRLGADAGRGNGAGEVLPWLRSNRFRILWGRAVEMWDDLNLSDGGKELPE